MAALDPTSPLPLYAQLRRILEDRIAQGVWDVGSRIPTENDLMAEFGVGRATTRQALLELVAEGYLHRHQGRGTFVNRRQRPDDIEFLVSFSAEVAARGSVPGARVLAVSVTAPDPSVQAALGIDASENILRIERLRTVDGRPVALETSHLIHRLCRGLEDQDLSGSLYQLLVNRLGIPIKRASQSIGSTTVGAREASVLETRPGSQVLLLERVTYTINDTPLDFLRFLFRGDLYKLQTELFPRSGRPV